MISQTTYDHFSNSQDWMSRDCQPVDGNEIVTEAESIEDVERKLTSFQERLLQHGKEMFGEEFVIMALSDTKQDGLSQEKGGRCNSNATNDFHPKAYRRDDEHSFAATKRLEEKKNRSRRENKARENAKSVLLRFLDDREELVKLRIINKAAQERLHERILYLESTMKRLHTIMRDSEKRKRTEILNTRAFLSELRKKLTSVERRQSRLLALMTMPDNEHRDAVLERHASVEKKETNKSHPRVTTTSREKMEGETGNEPCESLENTLSQLSKELKEIERSMQTFGDQNTLFEQI